MCNKKYPIAFACYNKNLDIHKKIKKAKEKLNNEKIFNALKDLLNGITKDCASTAIDAFVDALKKKANN